MISVFDLFKIGIGPSSSHTVGPMVAAKQFIEHLAEQSQLPLVTRLQAQVFGSLSLTGKGHQTDIAIVLGLCGHAPDSVDIEQIPALIEKVRHSQQLNVYNGQYQIDFCAQEGIIFHRHALPKHENGMTLTAWFDDQTSVSKTYYSIGGGFVVDDDAFDLVLADESEVPYPFDSAEQLLQQCSDTGLSISAIVMANEAHLHGRAHTEQYLDNIWQTMRACIVKGMEREGLLPGPLRVPRRAAALKHLLLAQEKHAQDPMSALDWVNMFAFAVNEENAAGGRVVTAPTNGACGIVPAVLAYFDKFIRPVGSQERERYLLTTSAIGGLYKRNASISGAEVGCQGEVGVACSMAAAGLAELFGASPAQVCIAAEIAMEHNLGLTCDPVAGQVQVPCIERNGMAAVKAINACRMAMQRTSAPRVSLDKVIETMLETGKDMNAKYRETSQGGLAIKVIC
ncbi:MULTISPECIES: L-serine ammonia-lyase [unclassified Vibrio]|uniref:L-serine dehydratase n=1 Tax=Vibrio sp. HB236076 TaxID=3232307 RepID=A0AB39HBX2_9VIBR|nr:L-serine ammonia-lyase [Vibrio sp. HB161653]MDP5253503.1 L-serine ammonia-lyase [Vibrio sp. HB161653]